MCQFKKISMLFILIFFAFVVVSCSNKNDDYIVVTQSVTDKQFMKQIAVTETHEGKLKMVLKSDVAIVNENNSFIHLELPTITFYDKNGHYVLSIIIHDADICVNTRDIKGTGYCVIDTVHHEHLETNDLIYNAKRGLIYSNNDVKITKLGETVYGTGFEIDTKLNKMFIKKHTVVFN
ncbi:MAG: LPS export ABC transporter periplasmic protein LptC [Endomicrobium sp.]|jgi:LPS export ABC transporter protein LptC|nr:LPS export ABC transporter periplasmic protein LptC [Endomicrobium sp.]